MSETFALAVHNEDLANILSLIPHPYAPIPCGENWTIVSADISDHRLDIDALRQAVTGLRHVSVFEAEVGQGRVHIENITESPLYTYGYEPLDPFSQSILYELLEAEWSNEIGRDETVNATVAYNLYRSGEVIYPFVSLRDDIVGIAARLDEFDSRFMPGQSPDIHGLL